jgi:hypothetical protein
MRLRILVMVFLLGVATAAPAQVNIGINISLFPELVQVPGYPVYYAPRHEANYFFYDGLYWVLVDDVWYSSDWYNGPWYRVAPDYVPVYLLRVPVRYYRHPPAYFRGWQPNAPPRWGEHWGRDWEQRRAGWDRWNRAAVPKPAPLPTYQRRYSGDRYPRADEQHALNNRNYSYRPRDTMVRDHVRPQVQAASAPPAQERGGKDARERAPRAQSAPERQVETPRRDAGGNRERPDRSASPPAQSPAPAVRPQTESRERQPRPPTQATPREQAPQPKPQVAPSREPTPRAQPQVATPREQAPRPPRQEAPPPGKGAGAAQSGERPGRDNHGQDKGSDRGREKGGDNK